MPKFYVMSGDLRDVLDRKDKYQAAIAAFRRIKETGVSIASIVKVSEQGFEVLYEDDELFSMDVIMEDAGNV